MSSPDITPGQHRITRRQMTKYTVVAGIVGLGAGTGIYQLARGILVPREPAAAAPGLTPEPTIAPADPTAAPKPTDAPTFTPTGTPPPTDTPRPTETATATPEPSPTSSPTATRETSPTPKPENPMKRYGSYLAVLPDNGGTVFIGSIPGTNNPDIVLVYVIRRDPNTKHITFAKYTTTPQNIQGLSFEANNNQTAQTSGFRIQATVGSNSNTLTGKFERGNPSKNPEYTLNFQAKLIGTGPDNLINTLRQAKMAGEKLSQISVQNIKDDFKGIIDFDNLPPQ